MPTPSVKLKLTDERQSSAGLKMLIQTEIAERYSLDVVPAIAQLQANRATPHVPAPQNPDIPQQPPASRIAMAMRGQPFKPGSQPGMHGLHAQFAVDAQHRMRPGVMPLAADGFLEGELEVMPVPLSKHAPACPMVPPE